MICKMSSSVFNQLQDKIAGLGNTGKLKADRQQVHYKNLLSAV